MVSLLNSILLGLGHAFEAVAGALAAFFGAVWGGLDLLLNPVLSPLLAGLNRVLTPVANGIYAALSPLPAAAGLVILSAVCGVVMMVLFKYLSNQTKIGHARDRMTAQLLALKLYKDDIGVAFRTQGRLLRALAVWQWHMLKPMALLIVILLPVFAQMGTRYQWRPLRPGEETVVRVELEQPASARQMTADLAAADGISEIVGPVPGGGALVWRIQAATPGTHALNFKLGNEQLTKSLTVGNGLEPVSAERARRQWTTQVLHPREPRLPADSAVKSIVIDYPPREDWFTGSNWWILWFFVVSMAVALAMLPFFKVRF